MEGTIALAQVLAQTAQGSTQRTLALFDALVRAIGAGATYANLHMTLHTPGEICGHIPGSHDD